MTQDHPSALTAIAAKVAGITGLSTTVAYPPEQTGETTFAAIFPLDGDAGSANAGATEILSNIAIDMLCTRNNLATDMELIISKLWPLLTALLEEVRDTGDQFSNTIETFSNLHFEYLPDYDYGGVQRLGYRITMQGVKFLVNL